MKKIKSFILLFTIVFLLSGCDVLNSLLSEMTSSSDNSSSGQVATSTQSSSSIQGSNQSTGSNNVSSNSTSTNTPITSSMINKSTPWRDYVNSYTPLKNKGNTISYLGEDISTTVDNDEQFEKVFTAALMYHLPTIKIKSTYAVVNYNKIVSDVSSKLQYNMFYSNLKESISNAIQISYTSTKKEFDFTFTYNDENYASTETTKTGRYTFKEPGINHLKNQDGTHTLPINPLAKTVKVYSSEQLLYVVSLGLKPDPISNSPADYVYNEAKRILKSICSNSMNGFEKCHMIYDYLVSSISYDKDLFELTSLPNKSNIKKYSGFFLEGALLEKIAVCDGISKAFMLLANMEGLKTIQVSGTMNGGSHAWNKVKVGTDWYTVDATNGSLVFTNQTVSHLSHRYLLFNDSMYTTTFVETKGNSGEAIFTAANGVYDYYGNEKLTINEEQVSLNITSQSQLNKVVKYMHTNKIGYLDMKISYSPEISISDKLSTAFSFLVGRISYGSSYSENILFLYFN